jgi:hypothetical protein
MRTLAEYAGRHANALWKMAVDAAPSALTADLFHLHALADAVFVKRDVDSDSFFNDAKSKIVSSRLHIPADPAVVLVARRRLEQHLDAVIANAGDHPVTATAAADRFHDADIQSFIDDVDFAIETIFSFAENFRSDVAVETTSLGSLDDNISDLGHVFRCLQDLKLSNCATAVASLRFIKGLATVRKHTRPPVGSAPTCPAHGASVAVVSALDEGAAHATGSAADRPLEVYDELGGWA